MDLNTDSSQVNGNLKVQYSTDNVNWIDVSAVSGGKADLGWDPNCARI